MFMEKLVDTISGISNREIQKLFSLNELTSDPDFDDSCSDKIFDFDYFLGSECIGTGQFQVFPDKNQLNVVSFYPRDIPPLDQLLRGRYIGSYAYVSSVKHILETGLIDIDAIQYWDRPSKEMKHRLKSWKQRENGIAHLRNLYAEAIMFVRSKNYIINF